MNCRHENSCRIIFAGVNSKEPDWQIAGQRPDLHDHRLHFNYLLAKRNERSLPTSRTVTGHGSSE